MNIADQLLAMKIDPRDARQVTGAIAILAATNTDRAALIAQWVKDTGDKFPLALFRQLMGLQPIGTWPRTPEAHHANPR